MSEKEIELVHGTANVFRDFGELQADLKQAKAVLAARIIAVLDDRGLAVRKAASLTGFAAADFSRVRNADLGRFTLDRLMKVLAALDANARVTVKVDVSRSAPLPEPLPSPLTPTSHKSAGGCSLRTRPAGARC
ncbi:MAG: XRE family transcriptional regulator [Holophagales bacterium]|nr:XRE family transcriptional regulator [Holophagales bacterium]MYF94907.1 XRE family transcriptional regulator [Holophagales bacterium]